MKSAYKLWLFTLIFLIVIQFRRTSFFLDEILGNKKIMKGLININNSNKVLIIN